MSNDNFDEITDINFSGADIELSWSLVHQYENKKIEFTVNIDRTLGFDVNDLTAYDLKISGFNGCIVLIPGSEVLKALKYQCAMSSRGVFKILRRLCGWHSDQMRYIVPEKWDE